MFVHALVAFTSTGQGGERTLRNLEMRLLADGVSVARTATDLVRYHDKLLIIDNRKLYMLGFNYTYIDIERSRSFGIMADGGANGENAQEKQWVDEAEKLFVADATRQKYTPECDTFLVSPGNSRKQLTQFIQGATRQLLIYDGKLSDPDMMKLLSQKAKHGVEIRVIGKAGKHAPDIKVAPLDMRLHAQAIVRDGEALYLGSQSLRALELDARREVGVILSDLPIIRKVAETFELDWGRIKNAQDVPLTEAEIAAEDPSRMSSAPGAAPDAEAEEDDTEDVQAATPVSDTPHLPPTLTIKEAVKEAIKDILLENMQDAPEAKIMKEAVKEAAKEALREIAGTASE